MNNLLEFQLSFESISHSLIISLVYFFSDKLYFNMAKYKFLSFAPNLTPQLFSI